MAGARERGRGAGMEGHDRELEWEDIGSSAAGSSSGLQPGSGPNGNMGSGRPSPAGTIGSGAGSDLGSMLPVDAVTGAMVSHFARELTQGGLSFWPQLVGCARKYFNVTHSYVLRKAVWQLLPLSVPKVKDGELGREQDFAARFVDGLEVSIEEPDLYIPTMSFITYVLLCGLIRGLQEQFDPEVFSTIITYALVALLLELLLVKAALTLAGASSTPIIDLAAILSYKYFYISLHLLSGLLMGMGGRPGGVFYYLISLGLTVSCGVALWQTLRRAAKLQPTLGQEVSVELHKAVLKGLPVFQTFVCYLLLPTWPTRKVAAVLAAKAATTLAPLMHAALGAVVSNASSGVGKH